jgi:hypothetical protein
MVPIILLFLFVSIIENNLFHPAVAVEQIVTKTSVKHLVVICSENHYKRQLLRYLTCSGEPGGEVAIYGAWNSITQ